MTSSYVILERIARVKEGLRVASVCCIITSLQTF